MVGSHDCRWLEVVERKGRLWDLGNPLLYEYRAVEGTDGKA
jgi:hypothetical protein